MNESSVCPAFLSAGERGKGALVRCSKIHSDDARKGLCESRPGPVNPFSSIFPPFVASAVCRDGGCQSLHPEELALIRGVAPSRAGEFATGRVCAHRVLTDLEIKAGPLLVGANGAPEWPKGIAGSISHTTGCCVAAACRLEDAIGLGIDVEEVDAVTSDIVSILCTEAERDWVGPCPCRWELALLFSAKESLFKGYHPLTGYFLEYSDVEVTLERATNRFSARLVNERSPSILGERVFPGCYRIDHRFVYTGLVLQGCAAASARTHPGARPRRGRASLGPL